MSHYVQAFIGSRPLLEKIQQQYAASRVVDLAQGLALLPLLDTLYDAIPNAEGFDLVEENWQFLAPKIVGLVLRHSAGGDLGYFETAYHGGDGDQGAILARDGKIIYGPEVGPGSINDILVLMGVEKKGALDEFAAVGLGRFRSNEKWLDYSDSHAQPERPGDLTMKRFAQRRLPPQSTQTWTRKVSRQRLVAPLRIIKTAADSKAFAEEYLREKHTSVGELMIIDERTISKPYGWIFFFNSKEFVLTGDWSKQLFGAGPLVVLGRFGTFGGAVQLRSSFDSEKTIRQFEHRLKIFALFYAIAVLILIGILIAALLYFLKHFEHLPVHSLVDLHLAPLHVFHAFMISC